MDTFRKGYKQYLRTTSSRVLSYIKSEKALTPESELGDLATLSAFDLDGDACFLILLDARPVGFVCVRFLPNDERQLTRLYVTPTARRRGCASYVLRGLKFTQTKVPVRYVKLVALCLKQGFKYAPHQTYPDRVAELVRSIHPRKIHVAR